MHQNYLTGATDGIVSSVLSGHDQWDMFIGSLQVPTPAAGCINTDADYLAGRLKRFIDVIVGVVFPVQRIKACVIICKS